MIALGIATIASLLQFIPLHSLKLNTEFDHKPLMGHNILDQEAISMWSSPDGQFVMHLDGSNFKEAVLNPANKKTDFLIIFYSHTCPHCQAAAPTLREFAKSVAAQRDRAIVGVYNCNRPFNAIYCREVKNYPTIVFFTKKARHLNDGRKIVGFGDMPFESMRSTFEHILAGKFDLNDSEEELLELDSASYMLTISNGIAHKKTFLVAFFNGDAENAWKTLAQLCVRWKSYVRIGFVNCGASAGNPQNPCRAVLGANFTQHLPFVYFIYEKFIPHQNAHGSSSNEGGGGGNWSSQYDPMQYAANNKNSVAYLRLQLVYKLFEVNYQNIFTKSLSNNYFVELPHPSYNIDEFVQQTNQFGLSPPNGMMGGQMPGAARMYANQKQPSGLKTFMQKIKIGFHPIHSTAYKTSKIKVRGEGGRPYDPTAAMLPQIWKQIDHFMQIYILLVFEDDHSNNGIAEFASKLILSLNHWKRYIRILPIRSLHPLAASMQFGGSFPFIKLYKIGRNQPLIFKGYGMFKKENADLDAYKDIIAATGLMEDDTKFYDYFMPIDCEKLFNRCRPLYFASETDILKALREAIFDEVVTKVEFIQGTKRRHLLNFLTILVEYLPDYTKNGAKWMELRNTKRAKLVFGALRNFLWNNKRIPVKEWEIQLNDLEKQFGRPFPSHDQEWRHCKAIQLKNARRFTCGMWTTFHVLTVNAYKRNADPRFVLTAIQGWVQSFFGCEDCRNHFMEMTNEAMPIRDWVNKREDVILYLWTAHNRVNERLEKEELYVGEKKMQSDVVFKKRQFPPKFLCPECDHGNGQKMLNFLVDYYERLEPAEVHKHFHSWERDLAYNGQWQFELWD